MTTDSIQDTSSAAAIAQESSRITITVHAVFRWLVRLALAIMLVSMLYWVFASDRYVSEAVVLIQNTETMTGSIMDLSAVLGSVGGATRPDQLLLREHLLSVDMLKKLDDSLDLRSHYSTNKSDIASRMWKKELSIEKFHKYYLNRVDVVYDDYAGVLRIKASAFNPTTAQAIVKMLVEEGERYMNQMSHELAKAQVDFLDTQVALAQDQVRKASQTLLDFQNTRGLASPQAAAESINAIISQLEAQRTDLQTKLAALPASLVANHPNRVALRQSLSAVEKQISREQARLASATGKSLNSLVEEQQRLQMDVDFKIDIYKTALVALEKGRMDASRTIKHVSVLQLPLLPEYPIEPRRLYGALVTLCISLLIIGIIKLLESIILDHVD